MTKTNLSEFREAVYQKVVWRPAAIMDLVDAVTSAGHVNSPVCLSESSLFRRKFSSVYDALVYGELGNDLKSLLSDSQDADWETIAGYEIHAVDATPCERMAAETLADRGVLKAQQKEPVRYGHKHSWLVQNYLQTEPQSLMEPDMAALENLLGMGKEKLSRKMFEECRTQGASLRMEDVIAQAL